MNIHHIAGKFNIGEAVISANYADMRVDIDADESVHHIKSDNMEVSLFIYRKTT